MMPPLNEKKPAIGFHELPLENLTTLHRAVDFMLKYHPDRAKADPSQLLPLARETLANLILPICDEEDLPAAQAHAERLWVEVCKDAGNVVTHAVVYLAAQDPLLTAERDDGSCEYFVPYISSARYIIAQPL